MRFSILSLFPEFFQSPLSCSLIKRACDADLLSIDFVCLKDFGEGTYRAVDDKPYGGGPGMVLMPMVAEKALGHLLGGERALDTLESQIKTFRLGKAAMELPSPYVIALSPQGKKLTSTHAKSLSQFSHLVLLCGHYEGIDERIVQTFVHEEISIGDYILTGGEPAALVLIDVISRFIPGVVKEKASVEGDSFEAASDMMAGGLKYPVYTRPQVWRGHAVPEILLSGNHAEITRWRKSQSLTRTTKRRPDLIKT